MKRAILVCPGRGSYSAETLGILDGVESAALAALDGYRATKNAPTPSELDQAERFSSRKHLAGEHASILTAACSLADLDQIDGERVEIVGACGNSMGWYTTLAAAGVLSIEDTATLIDTLGSYQAETLVGGQLVYPITDDEWRVDPEYSRKVTECIAEHDSLFWSIRLGGTAILGGDEDGLRFASKTLPPQESKGRKFPLRLPLHAAFHTPLMLETATRAQQELSQLHWCRPRWPIVDGHGNIWDPYGTCPAAIRNYTLGAQIVETFDFTLMLRTLLGETGPDVIILPGPGSNLGGAIAQVLIQLGWSRIGSRTQFMERQQTDPMVLAMARPDQRSRVVS